MLTKCRYLLAVTSPNFNFIEFNDNYGKTRLFGIERKVIDHGLTQPQRHQMTKRAKSSVKQNKVDLSTAVMLNVN